MFTLLRCTYTGWNIGNNVVRWIWCTCWQKFMLVHIYYILSKSFLPPMYNFPNIFINHTPLGIFLSMSLPSILSPNPKESRNCRELLPSQIWIFFSCSCLAFVEPLMNHSSSSTTARQNTLLVVRSGKTPSEWITCYQTIIQQNQIYLWSIQLYFTTLAFFLWLDYYQNLFLGFQWQIVQTVWNIQLLELTISQRISHLCPKQGICAYSSTIILLEAMINDPINMI